MSICKETGEIRMAVDYRALNQQTKKDIYLLPWIDNLLDKFCTSITSASLIWPGGITKSGLHLKTVRKQHSSCERVV